MFWIILALVSIVALILIFTGVIGEFNGNTWIAGLMILKVLLLFLIIAGVAPGKSIKEQALIKDRNRVNELIVITNATVTKLERVKRIEELMNTIERYNSNLALCGKNNKNRDNIFYIHFSNFDVSKYEFIDLEKIIEELKGE